MKALVLAAGLGTRLLPYTRVTPKPLFTLNGRPLLDRIIQQLIDAGAEAIVVNTHHLHGLIERFIANAAYPVPVTPRHEPEILGTGGAIRNLSDFWDDRPFWVVNSDIFTDIDLGSVAAYHRSHSHPVTLVLADDPRFNTVRLAADGRVTGFGKTDNPDDPAISHLTFSGIQVLDPLVLDYLPTEGFANSIDAFRSMIRDGKTITAYVARDARWSDLGTPDRYRQTAMAEMAALHLDAASPGRPLAWETIAGDGSDRQWHRVTDGKASLIMADHGIRMRSGTGEVDAFVAIGRHLAAQGLPVPKLLAWDTFSGLVLLEDLGSTSLEEHVRKAGSKGAVARIYRDVITLLIRLSGDGAKGFDPAWTCQTPYYDREVILEYECRYFMEAFISGWLGMETAFSELAPEFERLADRILAPGLSGFMHRDFQSRNVMVKAGRYHPIDFQGGRMGPITYDLASLLIDPYTDLDTSLRAELLEGFIETYAPISGLTPDRIREHYHLCSLSRNLQMLGAFGFLTRVKQKPQFRASIPAAVRNLKDHPLLQGPIDFPRLSRLVDQIPL